jgi:hypothetical protein
MRTTGTAGRREAHGGTDMQYMLLIYFPVDEDIHATPQAWGEYTTALQESGALVGGDGLQSGDTATTVRVRDGETLVSDGPFAETKELLGGYYVIEVPDLDAALAWAAKMPNIATGSVEVRPVLVYEPAGA